MLLTELGIGLCKCGHLQSHHSNQLNRLNDDRSYLEHHHGGCCKDNCKCKQFTFAGWASIEKIAAMYVEQEHPVG